MPRAFGREELSPGIFFDPGTFRWSAFADAWGGLVLSRGASIVSAGDAAARIGSGRMFVRPDGDTKSFDGGVFEADALRAVLEASSAKGLVDSDTPVDLAPSVPVDAEWRTFVVGGEVVAASFYRKDGKGDVGFHVPQQVVDLAFEAAEIWTPADVFCLDVALSEGRYGIVEANCFSASRFYGADATAVLKAVSEFVAAPGSDPRP